MKLIKPSFPSQPYVQGNLFTLNRRRSKSTWSRFSSWRIMSCSWWYCKQKNFFQRCIHVQYSVCFLTLSCHVIFFALFLIFLINFALFCPVDDALLQKFLLTCTDYGFVSSVAFIVSISMFIVALTMTFWHFIFIFLTYPTKTALVMFPSSPITSTPCYQSLLF